MATDCRLRWDCNFYSSIGKIRIKKAMRKDGERLTDYFLNAHYGLSEK